jgi:hypothetical protein
MKPENIYRKKPFKIDQNPLPTRETIPVNDKSVARPAASGIKSQGIKKGCLMGSLFVYEGLIISYQPSTD